MWDIAGQKRTVSLLQRSMEQGSLAHAYLLVGPPHVGKMTLALDLARALNCEAAEAPCAQCASCQKIKAAKHSDVRVIGLVSSGDVSGDKSRAEISIDQIREMQHAASLPPFEGRCRVFIIDGAEQLSNEAANCLLKTLEEPTGNVVFLLLTEAERLLPATVISRCQRLELAPLTFGEVEAALGGRNVEPQRARLLSRLCRGCLGWAVTAANDDGVLDRRSQELEMLVTMINADLEERFVYAAQLATRFNDRRESAYEVLDLWRDWWRDLMLIRTGCNNGITNIDWEDSLREMSQSYGLAQVKTFINVIQSAAEQLKQNVNARLALEVLMLNIPERKNG